MAILTAAKRKKMPSSSFALSGKRFPMNDPTHQRMAISGATRSEHAGNISHSTAERIKAEARHKLGISPGGYRANYEGSAQDTRQDRREAAKRGMSMTQWEGSAADKRMDARHSGKGGYYTGAGNPAQNRAIHAAEAKNHPRNHALAMASATHLLNMGHITPEHHARIQNHATNMLAAMRQMAPQQPQSIGAPDMSGGMGSPMGGGSPFGSFAP